MSWNLVIKKGIDINFLVQNTSSISLILFFSSILFIILLFPTLALASESERTIITPFTSQNLNNTVIEEDLGNEEINTMQSNGMTPNNLLDSNEKPMDFTKNFSSDNLTTAKGDDNNRVENISKDISVNNITTGIFPNTSSFANYEDPVDRISILYPSNWTKIEYPKGGMNYGINNRIIVNFLGPIVNDSSSINNTTSALNEWRTYVSIQFVDANYTNSLLSQNGTTVDPNVLGGHPAYMLISSIKENIFLDKEATNYTTIDIRKMQVWTTIDNDTYMFTYEAESSDFQDNLPIVKAMLKSFNKIN